MPCKWGAMIYTDKGITNLQLLGVHAEEEEDGGAREMAAMALVLASQKPPEVRVRVGRLQQVRGDQHGAQTGAGGQELRDFFVVRPVQGGRDAVVVALQLVLQEGRPRLGVFRVDEEDDVVLAGFCGRRLLLWW